MNPKRRNLKRRLGKKSKGQMFLISAVVIVVSLVIIKFSMAGPAAKKEEEVLRVRFENDIFENIIGELNNTLTISYNNPQNITTNVFDFVNFTEQKIKERSMSFNILYVGIISNKTISEMNVSLVNMLGGDIDANFTIAALGQSKTNGGMVDYERWDTNFTITPGTEYSLVLTYNSTAGDASSSKAENITVKTKSNRDVYVGFYYAYLKSQDATHVEKTQKTVNIR